MQAFSVGGENGASGEGCTGVGGIQYTSSEHGVHSKRTGSC